MNTAKISAPMMTTYNMPLVRSVCASASQSDCHVSFRRNAHSTSASKAPTEAASVGVNQPNAMPVSTQVTSAARSSTRKIAVRRSAQDARGDGGAMEGRMRQMITIVAMYSSVCVSAGMIAAVNSLPMDCSAMMPKTMSAPDGGVSEPSVPPAATAPDANAVE